MQEFEASTLKLCDFIAKSPTCFHAVENSGRLLKENGFEELYENTAWSLAPGRSYFVRRNGSSLIAFKIPPAEPVNFQAVASHCDSPSFKIKENPELLKAGHYIELNVEKYGGMLCAPWFDRPLSIAGRVAVDFNGNVECRNIDFARDLVMLPSLAIHMNRQANENVSYNIQNDMLPVFGDESCKGKFLKQLCALAEAPAESILGYDLLLYDRSRPSIWGADREFFSSPRLDDLQNVFASLEAFVNSKNESSILICAVFDNEEVGSLSRQGADSTFLQDILERIVLGLGLSREQYHILLARSFMLSADNAHAAHPSHADKADPVNRPVLNGGPVIKFNAAQKYTTDAATAGVFRKICERSRIPTQVYTNNSDIPGGSTLGSIALAHVPFSSVDIGCPQLAMHSPYETGGIKDTYYMIEAMKAFYNTVITKDGFEKYVYS